MEPWRDGSADDWHRIAHSWHCVWMVLQSAEPAGLQLPAGACAGQGLCVVRARAGVRIPTANRSEVHVQCLADLCDLAGLAGQPCEVSPAGQQGWIFANGAVWAEVQRAGWRVWNAGVVGCALPRGLLTLYSTVRCYVQVDTLRIADYHYGGQRTNKPGYLTQDTGYTNHVFPRRL